MCKINDSNIPVTEVIHYENCSTETYASTFLVKYYWLFGFFFIFLFFSACKVVDFTKRKTNHKAFDNFKALCNENKLQCK